MKTENNDLLITAQNTAVNIIKNLPTDKKLKLLSVQITWVEGLPNISILFAGQGDICPPATLGD